MTDEEVERELCSEQAEHTREVLLHAVTRHKLDKAEAEVARLRGVVGQWPNLQMVSRWLKERREASLKGGISLQASWEECLRTILRAHQEIDAYVATAASALQEGKEQ